MPRPELPFTESADALVIDCPMPVGNRILFFLAGLFPLLAPYELLLKPRWDRLASPFFALAALISLGALALTALLILAAIAGLHATLRFDRARGVFAYTTSSPVARARTVEVPLSSLAGVSVGRHDWSDGPPSFSLDVRTNDGRTYATSSTWSEDEVRALANRAAAFVPAAA